MNIGIAGIGGIGSNVAVNLVRSGIRKLTIVDFDRVETSNLNRQFYFADQVGKMKIDMLTVNLQRIDPDLQICSQNIRITPDNISSFFHECDTIVEGFDNSEDKKMVLEHYGASKYVISASGIAGNETATITVREFGNCHIVGDFITDCNLNRLYAHKINAVAARMTELLLNRYNNDQ